MRCLQLARRSQPRCAPKAGEPYSRHRACRRSPRVCAAVAPASDALPDEATQTDGAPEVLPPDALSIPSGVLSHVSESREDPGATFRCVGCTEDACQSASGCAKTQWRFSDLGYLKQILTARVYDVAVESPLELAEQLSRETGNRIYLKREDVQPVFSFKLRGAFNKMSNLSKEQLNAGVICSSAGNHAQGVALAARRLGTSAVICMPENTPDIKVNAVRALGGTVRLVGESYTETQAYAWAAAEEEGRVFVAPYDDPFTIAGQGTVGAEITKQLGARMDELEAIFVAVGGGGLIAGIAAYVKALKPSVKIIGVEPAGANCMAQSLQAGRRVQLAKVDAFADGVAVKSVGLETFRLCQKFLDGVVLVDNSEISAAIKDVFSETRSILEPAGAVAVAGAKAYLKHRALQAKADKATQRLPLQDITVAAVAAVDDAPLVSGASVVAVASGANMNFDRLRLVADLANYGLRTEAMCVVSIPEHQGAFRRFIKALYGPTASEAGGSVVNVTEFKYRYSVDRDAKILFSISARGAADAAEAVQRVNDAGFPCADITGQSTAQVHLRHMVGGRPRTYTGVVEDERMVVVQFPERAGALLQFLDILPSNLNVTMFHYRATGNRSSSVLLGLQVPPHRQDDFEAAERALEPADFVFEELSDADRQLFDQFVS